MTSESDSHPLPQHEAPVDQTAPVDGAAPVDQQQNQEAGSNLPLPPSEEGAAEQAPTEDVPLPQAPKGPAALRIPTFR